MTKKTYIQRRRALKYLYFKVVYAFMYISIRGKYPTALETAPANIEYNTPFIT